MSIEEDMFNSFKYAGFGKNMNPNNMMNSMIRNMEIQILKKMEMKLQAKIRELNDMGSDGGKKVPHVDDEMDPFKILGINMNSTREEVDKAYKDKAWKAHPDRGGTNMDMTKINAAYEAIKLFNGWH